MARNLRGKFGTNYHVVIRKKKRPFVVVDGMKWVVGEVGVIVY